MRDDVQATFDHGSVARDAVSHWSPGSLDSLRLVGDRENFVYTFRDDAGSTRYLRLTPLGERREVEVRAELDFVHHLIAHGAHVAASVPTSAGHSFERIPTPQGDTFAVVFEEVRGTPVAWGTDAENRAILSAHGRSLGRIHRIAQDYRPPKDIRRRHWYEDDLFTDPLTYLSESEPVARREYETLIQWMLKRPRTRDNYGMVHGDFQAHNTLRRDDGWVVAFDFDDCCYHWFMYDVAVAIRAARKLPDKYRGPYLKVLLEGYATENDPGPQAFEDVTMFARLAALYRFVTLLRTYDVSNLTREQKDRLDARREALAHPQIWE
jgi:Ser/Thr protein kinase RdoA (MazF antagonist)